MDFNNFLSQILPVLAFYIIIPIALLILYFGILRPILRRNRARSASNTPSNTANSSALAELRAARPADEEDVDLPDISDLLNGVSATGAGAGASAAAGAVRLADGRTVSAEPAMAILRDADGRLLVQLNGTAYYSMSEAPLARRTVSDLLTELADGPLKAAPADAPRPTAAPEKPTPQPTQKPTQTVTPQKLNTEEMLPPPPIDEKGTMPGDLPSYRYDDNPLEFEAKGLRGRKIKFEAPPTVDIASAIDAYLQHKLRYTPQMDGHKISIRPSPSGGVRILVDGDIYEAVDEVEDPDIRNFIQAAINEWQERQ